MTMKQPVNLSESQRDYAIFLPAISTFYNSYISKQRLGEHVPDERLPDGFDRGVEGLNFLNEEQGYFTYRYGLYSAGHAQLDLKKSMDQESMIQKRDREKTIIVGDSGGFQIGKGLLKFDWQNFEGPESNKTRQQILEWLESAADWSVFLDVPGWACDDHHSKKTGLKTYEDCLEKTRFNNEYFLKNRLGKTKFLNVLQGTNWEEADLWYNGVKEFSDPAVWGDKAAEGWAMGSANKSRMDITLKRLMVMREDGMLKGKNWMHFLGTAQLDWSCYLTLIQRQVRKHINPEMTFSFDAASAFIATANGLSYTKIQHTSKRWSIIMEKAPDNKALAGSDIPFPFESEIGRRLVMGDICHYAPGMLNKIGKEGKTSWDSFSYALLMGHNVYMHIDGVQRANQLMDIEIARVKDSINWRSWKKLKVNDFSDEFSPWVPRNILYFDRFVEDLFNTKSLQEAFEMIEEGKAFLMSLEGSSTQDGLARNHFHNLFDHDQTVLDKSVSPVFAMPELDEDKLIELEEGEEE